MTALANAIEHEPALRPVLVEVLPNAHARMRVPDWLAPYGSEDHTSFGIGCVY